MGENDNGNQPLIHLGYVYKTNYYETTKTWSDGCESGENEWTTTRGKADGSDEPVIFRKETEEWGPYFHKITVEYFNIDKHLTSIMNEYGADVLLGDLTSYFPSISFNKSKEKCTIYDVYQFGAAKILKDALQLPAVEKETAAQKAIDKLIEAGLIKGKANGIISDFTSALGWHEDDIFNAVKQKIT